MHFISMASLYTSNKLLINKANEKFNVVPGSELILLKAIQAALRSLASLIVFYITYHRRETFTNVC
jgi:hypothetical protein